MRLLALLLAALAAGCQSPFDADRAWLRLENAHLVVFSLAPPDEARAAAEALERFRSATSALLRLRRPEGAPKLAVLVVDDAEDLAELCPRGAVGCYGKGPDGEGMAILAGRGDERSRHTLQHEYVHALVRNHAWSVPIWFEEGLAELLSTLEVEGDEVVIGRPPENAVDSVRNRPPLLPLSTVLRRDYARDRDYQAYFQYWTLVRHWYVETPDRAALNTYLERCHAGEDWVDAFEPAFGARPDTYWRREVMPKLAGGTIRVKRVTIRRPPPDLAFVSSSATGTEVAAYLRESAR